VGFLKRDLIGLRDEDLADSESMLVPVMKDGKRLFPAEPLPKIQELFRKEFALLPETYKDLEGNPNYPVEITPRLQTLQDQVRKEISEKELGLG
jgi:hypothetical protein